VLAAAAAAAATGALIENDHQPFDTGEGSYTLGDTIAEQFSAHTAPVLFLDTRKFRAKDQEVVIIIIIIIIIMMETAQPS
jgi:hypothetical protein